MPYRVVLPDDASALVDRLPQPVAAVVSRHLRQLSEHPVGLSKPAFAPLSGGQKYEFEARFQDMDYYFTVVFRYGADEQTLHVIALDLMTV
jgi:hypothetical protein